MKYSQQQNRRINQALSNRHFFFSVLICLKSVVAFLSHQKMMHLLALADRARVN